MTDINEAYQIATERYKKPDYCTEFERAYHFIAEEDRWQIADLGIVVWKEDGQATGGMSWFDSGEVLKHYKIENGQFIEYEPEEEEWKKWDFSAEAKNTR